MYCIVLNHYNPQMLIGRESRNYWSPFEKQHIASIESIQRAAARFVSSDYSRYSSVTGMAHSLGWDSIEKRNT